MIKKRIKISSDERGLVAIVLTLFVMLVLSIVVLTFSQVSRREQRQSLDRQLSSQAFYAAESGINTMINCIRTTPVPAQCSGVDNSNCGPAIDASKRLDNAGTFSYSCVLYDKAPPTIQYSSVDTQKGEFLSLETLNNNLNKLKIVWNKSDGGSNFSGCADSGTITSFPASPGDSNCDAGMLRLAFMPVSNAGVNRNSLNDASYTVFLRPSRNGSGVTNYQFRSVGFDSQGQVVPANCSGTRCSVTISGMPAGGAVFLLVRSIYHNNAVDIEGYDNSGSTVRFSKAQVKIDSTGRASDVLRRLQVRMPLYEEYTNSRTVNVLDIMSGICKRLKVYPPVSSADPNISSLAGYANNDDCGGIN